MAVCQVEIADQQSAATDGEVDHVLWVSRQELLAMIAAGQITDGHTLSAAMMLLAAESA